MVDTFFLMYASKKKHEEFVKWANTQVKYEYSGKLRKGVHQPLVAEVKLYGARIKKEYLAQMLSDFDVMYIDDRPMQKDWYSANIISLFSIPMKIFRFIFRQKKLIKPKRKYYQKGWKWVVHLFDIKDHIDENGEEAL